MNPYVDTILQAARARLADQKQAFEMRNRQWGALNSFIEDTPFTSPDLADLKKAEQQLTKALFLKRRASNGASARGCSPTGNQGGSGIQDVTWETRVETVKVDRTMHQNNEYSAAQALAIDWQNAEADLWSYIDSQAVAYLNTNRSQVNSADGKMQFSWDGVNYWSDVAKTDEERFYNYAFSEMKLNNYFGSFKSVHNTDWESVATFIANQGEANQTNLGFQFNNMNTQWTGYGSNEIVADGVNRHAIYIIPQGALAFQTWANPAYASPVTRSDRTFMRMESIYYPGRFIQVMKVEDCADTTADGGTTQSLVDTYELSVDFTLNHAVLSNAGETPIFKHNVAAA